MESLKQVRIYGTSPFQIVLLHGGPGAPGEMQPVAEALSTNFGILEPFQSKNSIQGQVEELKEQVDKYADKPVTLVGWSWGAWLGFLFTSEFPNLVKKLILISSGPFEQKYVQKIKDIRMSHLTETERKRVEEIEEIFKKEGNHDDLFAEYGYLLNKGDIFESNNEDKNYDPIQPNFEIYNSVWPEAAKLRESGDLLKYAEKISCPVVAIHGDYDPHPADGVRDPLSKVIKNFKFELIENCGHYPWFEKQAKEKFYDILIKGIGEE